MKDAPAARAARSRIVRVMIYYVVVIAGLFVLIRTVPEVREAVAGGVLARLAESDPFRGGGAPVGVPVDQTPWAGGLLGLICMLGTLIVMAPVTWVYMVTRRHRGYDESMVHALIILPVAVTGIVMIVRESVALAFSLAGIVAAVRFRTTLEDTKDAVYIFLAIGVGIASGAQALGLAFVLSVVFNLIVLVLWATRFGNPYAAGTEPGGHLALGEALAGPASTATRRLAGDPAILDAASPRDIAEALERAARLERHLAEERERKKTERANVLLLVGTSDVAGAQSPVESVLEELSSRWKLTEIVQTRGGGWILEYLVRVDDVTEGLIVERLRSAAGPITVVELRSLEGLKSKA